MIQFPTGGTPGSFGSEMPTLQQKHTIPYPTAGESISIQLETLQFYPWSEYFIRSQR